MMKEFLDNTLPDPMFYLVDKQDLILNSSKQSICWMLKTDWDDIPNNQRLSCEMSDIQGIKDFDSENLSFITHSLGSEILIDSILNISQQVIDIGGNKWLEKLQNKEFTIYMLANQLPILEIGRPLPKVHNQIPDYCTKTGTHYNNRIFKGVNIVAFSDPNDLLSYAIPQGFADKYIDSRVCPLVTNVSVNVAPEILAFGIGFVNPIDAHTDYDTSPKVIKLITNGTYNFDSDKELKENCYFIRLKKDNNM